MKTKKLAKLILSDYGQDEQREQMFYDWQPLPVPEERKENNVVSWIVALLMLAASIFLIISGAQGQTYKLDKSGKVTTIVKDTTKKVKKSDSVYQVVNGTTFYKGAKGGIYYWKTSKKTGQPYKVYVK